MADFGPFAYSHSGRRVVDVIDIADATGLPQGAAAV